MHTKPGQTSVTPYKEITLPGTSNFQDHNPALTNTESDATYATDALRTGGIATNNTLPSPWLNKIWRQSSVFCAAFGDMMAAKGYTVSDAVRSTLAGVLTNIMTAADFATAFASAFGSAISGYATQAWVSAQSYMPGSTPVVIANSAGYKVQTGTTAGLSVTFPEAFSGTPVVTATGVGGSVNLNGEPTASGFNLHSSGVSDIHWIAVGPA